MHKNALNEEAILSCVFETMQDGVTILDLELNVGKVNAVIEQWYPGTQLVGQKCYAAYHGLTEPCEDCPSLKTIRTGEVAHKLQCRTIEDKSYWFDIYTFPITDPTTKEIVGIMECARDISEQQKINEALRASETKYRSLVEHIPAVIYLASPDDYRTTLFVSPQIKFLLGFSHQDFEDDPLLWEKQLHDEDRDKVLAEVGRCQATGKPFVQEYRLWSRGGRLLWVHDEAWLVRDSAGRPLFLQGVVQDITEGKQKEAAFFQEQKKYQVLAESAPLGIAIIGHDGRYKYLNPKFIKTFGYTLDDLPTGREWFTKAYPDAAYRRQVILDWKLYLQESQFGETRPRVFTVICKDGSMKIINFQAVSLEGGDQFLLYEDITERRHVEEALRENEARFRLLLECAADALFVHENGKILDVNQQACDSLGYSREELSAMSIPDIEIGVSPEELADLWRQDSLFPSTVLGTHRRKDGSTFPVEVKTSNFDYQGRRLRMALARDVTERQRAEEALKQSELKYRTLVEQIPAITYITSLDDPNAMSFISPQVETILGFTPAEYEADPHIWVRLMHPDDRERVLPEVARCHKTGEPFSCEYRMLARDGRIVWFHDEARLVKDASERHPFLQGVMLDITASKELKEALQESEAHYRTLFETSPDAILLFDTDLKLTMANTAAATLYGVERSEEMVGKSAFDFVALESLSLAQELNQEMPDTDNFIEAEFVLLKSDGSPFLAETRTTILRKSDGLPKAFLSVAKDITARKQAEEKLQSAKEEWERTFDAIPDLIMILDNQHRIVRANRAMAQKLGCSPEDVIGLTCYQAVHGSETPPPFCPHSSMLANGGTQQIELYEEKLNGYFIVTVTPLYDLDGRVAGSVHVATDITERKLAEEALRDSEEKYRLLVQQIPALVFRGYEDWSIECFDNKIEELTGYPKEDFNSRRLTWRELIPAEELPYVKQIFRKALKGDGSYFREHRIRKKGGDYAWVQCRGQIFCNEKGEVEYISGVTFDITDRKRAETALRESEERYRLMAENVSDVIWIVNLDLKFTYISPSIQQQLGYPPDEIKGKSIGEVLPPASLGIALEIFSEEIANEKQEQKDLNRSRVFELEEIHKNGSTIYTEVKASFIRDSNNQPLGILGATRDITERKQSEKNLRRREAALEAVSFAAETFLQDSCWEDHIQEILKRLGQAIEASRVYIFENHKTPDGVLLTSQRYEWVGPGITPQIDNLQLQGFPYEMGGFKRWAELLLAGQVIWGHVSEFPPSEQELLADQDIKSIVVVPIYIGQDWWGFIGFDECVREREWSPMEVDALLTAANILGLTILHNTEENALRESEEKLRSLSYQLLTVQEQERKRLATELHDTLGHDLLLLKLKLESLQSKPALKHASLKKEVRQIIRSLQESVRNVRNLQQDLGPGSLEDLGLTKALHFLVVNFTKVKKIGWQTDLENIDNLFGLSLQTAIYRVVQEALTNIGKHAKAKHVMLRAKKTGQRVSFTIEDDGKGFKLTAGPKSKKTLGLLAMEERINIIGGSFEISSRVKGGTRISFTVPLSKGGN